MELRAEVYTRKQLGTALDNVHIKKIYAPCSVVDEALASERERIILIPPVYLADCQDEISERFSKLLDIGFKNVLVHTVGHIELFSNMGFQLFGGHRLNCTNSESLAFLAENGIKDVIVSPELTAFQINLLDKHCKTGFLAYGHLPLMITRRCPIKNGKPCGKECCRRTIKDRMNNNLHVICSENTAEILNSDVLYLADKLDKFDNTDFAVLKFTIEENINDVIFSYIEKETPEQKNFTRGLYFRGIKG